MLSVLNKNIKISPNCTLVVTKSAKLSYRIFKTEITFTS